MRLIEKRSAVILVGLALGGGGFAWSSPQTHSKKSGEVQRYAQDKYGNSPEKVNAIIQLGRALQDVLRVETSDESALKQAMNDELQATQCLKETFGNEWKIEYNDLMVTMIREVEALKHFFELKNHIEPQFLQLQTPYCKSD